METITKISKDEIRVTRTKEVVIHKERLLKEKEYLEERINEINDLLKSFD